MCSKGNLLIYFYEKTAKIYFSKNIQKVLEIKIKRLLLHPLWKQGDLQTTFYYRIYNILAASQGRKTEAIEKRFGKKFFDIMSKLSR